jgi:hypothetical protein
MCLCCILCRLLFGCWWDNCIIRLCFPFRTIRAAKRWTLLSKKGFGALTMVGTIIRRRASTIFTGFGKLVHAWCVHYSFDTFSIRLFMKHGQKIHWMSTLLFMKEEVKQRRTKRNELCSKIPRQVGLVRVVLD